MRSMILKRKHKLDGLKDHLKECVLLKDDIDFKHDFILPYSNAHDISNIKLVIIGQDPTIQGVELSSQQRQKEITTTLDLNNNGNLRRYCDLICTKLNLDLDKNVYATNLCKCVFKEKPAYNGVLDKHSHLWLPLLKQELSVFPNSVIYITLGEPLLKQIIHSNMTKVRDYWGYMGKSQSNYDFRSCETKDNWLQKRLYPLAHQPTWNRKKFYRIYLDAYLQFIIENEKYNK